MGWKWTVVDRGYTKLKAETLKLKGRSTVMVGVQGAAASAEHEPAPPPGGEAKPRGKRKRRITNAQVATWMEYGTVQIPARSFLRATIEANATKYYQFIKRGLVAVVNRELKDSDTLLALLGERCVSDTRLTIRKGIAPPLSEVRIARKKSSKPLIDTGQLINSITYRVEKK